MRPTLTTRQLRQIDPLAYVLRCIRMDAGKYIHRMRRLVEQWSEGT